MNNIIELLPTKLIGVLVPEDASEIRNKLSYEGGYHLVFFEPRIEPYLALQSVRIPSKSNDNFNIIGTITSDYKFDFDCEKYLNKVGKRFFEYLKPGMMTVSSMNHNFPFENSKDSFISLLKANNVQIQSNQKLLILEKL